MPILVDHGIVVLRLRNAGVIKNQITSNELYKQIMNGKFSFNKGMLYENVIAQMIARISPCSDNPSRGSLIQTVKTVTGGFSATERAKPLRLPYTVIPAVIHPSSDLSYSLFTHRGCRIGHIAPAV